jgi:hypothetical protein
LAAHINVKIRIEEGQNFVRAVHQKKMKTQPAHWQVYNCGWCALFQQRVTMSQQEGDNKEVGYEHAYEYNEDESEDKSDNNVAVVKPMNSIWECKHLCIKTQEGIRGGIH